MSTDQDMAELIHAAGSAGADVVISPFEVVRIARHRSRRRAAILGSALLAAAVAVTAAIVSRPGAAAHRPDAATSPTIATSATGVVSPTDVVSPTAVASPTVTVNTGPGNVAPACSTGFDVTPTGGAYSEDAVLARVAIGQPVTITVTMRLTGPPVVLTNLDLVFTTPEVLETPVVRSYPFPSVRDVHLFSGTARAGRRFSATVRIDRPGRYAVVAYSQTMSGLCIGPPQLVTMTQQIGFVVVH
jgi:hypothetical protein